MRNRLAPIIFSFTTLVVLLAVVYLVSLFGDDQPDEAACRAAMSAQFDASLAHPDAPADRRPSACDGVSDSALEAIAAALIAEKLFSVTPTP